MKKSLFLAILFILINLNGGGLKFAELKFVNKTGKHIKIKSKYQISEDFIDTLNWDLENTAATTIPLQIYYISHKSSAKLIHLSINEIEYNVDRLKKDLLNKKFIHYIISENYTEFELQPIFDSCCIIL